MKCVRCLRALVSKAFTRLVTSAFPIKHAITHTDLGEDIPRIGRILLYLAPYICHINAQDLVVCFCFRTPDLANQKIVGQHLTGVLAEQCHDLEFVEREMYILAVHKHTMLIIVNRQSPYTELAGTGDAVVVE